MKAASLFLALLTCLTACTTVSSSPLKPAEGQPGTSVTICPKWPIAGDPVAIELREHCPPATGACPRTYEWLGRLDVLRRQLADCHQASVGHLPATARRLVPADTRTGPTG